MRRPRLRFLALAVLGLSVGQLAAAADKQEPSYKGKPLSAWVADLKSGDADTRFDAAIALGRLGPLAAPAVPDLIRLFKEKDQDVAGAARIALRRIGKPAVPALLRALADKSEDVADSAKATLSRIGEPAVGPLLDAIRGPNADLRRRAASALIWMDRSVQSPLIAALKDKDVRVRRAAAKALGGEEHQGAQALEALTEALRDKDVEVRSAAVASLEDQGEAALGPLAGVVKDPAPKVRRAAISALGRVYSGMAGKAPSLAPLIEALKDKDLMVRGEAASAIPRTKEMVPQLLTALKNEPKEARLEIIHVLELIGPGARAAVPALVEALKDPDVVVRHSAADALKAIDAAAAKRAGLDD